MWENFPVVTGWRTIRRKWFALWLIPAGWDILKWVLAISIVPALNLYFGRWDFTLGFEYPDGAQSAGHWFLRYTLPPSMPTVEQLGVAVAPAPPETLMPVHLIAMVGMLLLDCVIRAGYLNLVNSAVHQVGPTFAGFWRGVVRYAPRLILLALIWIGWSELGKWLATRGTIPHVALPGLNVFIIIWLALAEFISITDDVLPVKALIGTPLLVFSNMGPVLSVIAVSGVASAALTGLVSVAGLVYPWVLAPLWALVGTWLTASMLAGLQVDISTRPDPTGNTSWLCPSCKVGNHPWASTCVCCGQHDPARQKAPQTLQGEATAPTATN